MKVSLTLGLNQTHDLISLSSSDELLQQGVIDMTDNITFCGVTAVYLRRKLKWWMSLLNLFGANFQESRRVAIDPEEGELRKSTLGNWQRQSVLLHRYDLAVEGDLELCTVHATSTNPEVEAFDFSAWRGNVNRRSQAA